MKEYKLKINGNEYNVSIDRLDGQSASVSVNGRSYTVETGDTSASASRPAPAPKPVATAAPAPVAAPAPAAAGGGAVKSPLPGVVLDIQVAVGDTVQPGQRLMILEAMKMENNIDSDKAGTVKEIKVSTGDSVLEGDVLVVIE